MLRISILILSVYILTVYGNAKSRLQQQEAVDKEDVSSNKESISNFLYSMTPKDSDQLHCLQILYGNGTVDFWKRPGAIGRSVDILIHEAKQRWFEDELRRHNLSFTVKDLQQLIKEEASENKQVTRQRSGSQEFATNQYHSHKEIVDFLQTLKKSNLVSVFSIGQSIENRDIPVIKISSKQKGSSEKKAILLEAGIHAREWIAPATAVYIIDKLVNNYHKDATIKQLVDGLDWYVIPLTNPDGYEYSRSAASRRMWRKNRRRVTKSCIGVDLNRNFAFAFGGAGASSEPCSDTYKGSKGFSEPESLALSKFILSKKKQLLAYFTFHSYGQDWLIPFGHKAGEKPENFDEMLSAARVGAEALKKVAGSSYRVGNTVDLLYPAAGGSDDWAKGVAQIPYVYTMELRPKDEATGFIISPSFIDITGEETFQGVGAVANILTVQQRKRIRNGAKINNNTVDNNNKKKKSR